MERRPVGASVQKMEYIKLRSPSKINFALWIKEKRADNYHEIETIFHEYKNLYDELEIEFLEDKNLKIEVIFKQDNLNKLISEQNNLAYQAADLFLKNLKATGKCKITINKQIPIQAGLGGGSSNAANVLKGLNQIFNAKFSVSKLLEMAQKLGSDVPFFINGGTCLGKGKGEILESINNNLNLEIKILKPENISIDTKWAYEQIDLRKFTTDGSLKINNLISSIKKGDYDLFFKNVFNDFETVTFSVYPQLAEIRNKLLQDGFKASCLCGSGSAIYGIKRLT